MSIIYEVSKEITKNYSILMITDTREPVFIPTILAINSQHCTGDPTIKGRICGHKIVH